MITQYEHVVPYEICQEHAEENIVLLCANHHQEVTSGRLSKNDVYARAKTPFSHFGRGHPYYRIPVREGSKVIFGNNIIDQFSFLTSEIGLVDFAGGTKLSVEASEGFPKFSGSIHSFNGQEVLRFEENVITLRSMNVFDVSLQGKRFTVRAGERRRIARFIIDSSEFKVEDLKAFSPTSGVHVSRSGTYVLLPGGGYKVIGDNHYSGLVSNSKRINFISNTAGLYLANELPIPDIGHVWKWLFSAKNIKGAKGFEIGNRFNRVFVSG